MAPLALLWMMFSFVSPFAFAAILLGYLLPHAVVSLFFTSRDLKKAYDAEWALVTGASSGEIKERCQIAIGLSVILRAETLYAEDSTRTSLV